MKNGIFLFAALLGLSLSTACHQSMKARTPSGERKTQITFTTVVKNERSLPRCDAGTEGIRAYLSAYDTFMKCSNHSWQSARPGDRSESFAARAPIRYNEWYDSKRNRHWSAPVNQELPQENLKADVCQKGWKLPTEDELREASINGLFDGVKAHGGIGFDKAWTESLKAMGGISKAVWETPEIYTQSKDMKAGVYCVKPA